MKIQIKNIEGLILPQSARESDTGYDIIATSDPLIVGEKSNEGDNLWKSVLYIEYGTNLFISPQRGDSTVTVENTHWTTKTKLHNKYGYSLIYPRSSISKYNLVLKNSAALIDHGFTGEIRLRFAYQWQPEDQVYFSYADQGVYSYGKVNMSKIYKKGDKCGQLVAAWKEYIKWNLVDELGKTERNDGGFGSSGN